MADSVAITTLVLALITAVLAGASFWTIRQNYKFREKDRKERLLNEIIEWAEDVSVCGLDIESNLQSVAVSDPVTDEKIIKAQAAIYDRARNHQDRFFIIRKKGEHVKNIISFFGSELQAKTSSVIELLDKQHLLYIQYIDLCGQCMDAIQGGKVVNAGVLNNQDRTWEEIARNTEMLRGLAVKVIEEGTKIETEDIRRKKENMSKEAKSTVSKELTLKDIEEHLERQDIKMERQKWFALGAIGFAVALTAVSLWIGTRNLSPQRVFLFAVGFLVMIIAWIRQPTSRPKM